MHPLQIVLTVWFILSLLVFFYWEIGKGKGEILEGSTSLIEGIVEFGVLFCFWSILSDGIRTRLLSFIPSYLDEMAEWISFLIAGGFIWYFGDMYKKASSYEAKERIRYEAEQKRREDEHQQD